MPKLWFKNVRQNEWQAKKERRHILRTVLQLYLQEQEGGIRDNLFKPAYGEKKLLIAIRQIITSLVHDDGFHDLVERSVNDQFDPSGLNQELETATQELKRLSRLQQQIENQLNCIDYEQKNAERLEESLNNRLFKVLDDITDTEERIASINDRLENAEMLNQTKIGIYAFLRKFDMIYDKMADEDKRAFMKAFIDSIELYPKKHPSKLLIKRINFNFPIAYKDGKEYSSLFFYNGEDDDDDGNNGSDGGGSGGGNDGGDFSTLTGDCLYINVSVDQLRGADPDVGGAVQKLLRAAGQVDPQIFDAILVTAGVGDLPGVNGHGLARIAGLAGQRVPALV